MVPYKTPAIFRQLMPSRIWRVDTKGKKIYLTFDDGPIPELTEWVLETLAEKEVKATFFCVGENVDKHPEIFKRIIDEGHSVGNHSQHHLNGFNTSIDEYLKDILLCDESMAKHGVKTDLFRPPYGRLKFQQMKRLSNKRVVMWDVLSKDYLMTLAKEKVLEASIQASEPGTIIVFHDNLKAEKNLKYALPKYIDYFKSQGYSFEAL